MIRRMFGILNKLPVPEYTKVEYTTPGTYTFEVPEGVTTIKATIAGAGGGGGGGHNYKGIIQTGKTGGTGGFQVVTLNVEKLNTLSITVGAGGIGGEAGNNDYHVGRPDGSPGGTSTVQSYSSTGGGGGEHAGGDTISTNGTPLGPGGAGGIGGTGGVTSTGSSNGKTGSNGWVYIEYGEGIE